MSEDKDLLSRIAQLAGKRVVCDEVLAVLTIQEGHINLHKVNTPVQDIRPRPMQTWSQPAIPPFQDGSSYQPGQALPYSRRGGRVGKPTLYSHRNRSLVLNNSALSMSAVGGDRKDTTDKVATNAIQTRSSGNAAAHATAGWISKRDRHMQLINPSIYDREANLRSKAIDQTRRQVAKRRDEREKSKIHKHLQKIADSAATRSFSPRPSSQVESHELSINGLRFLVCDGGSRLVRIMSIIPSSFRIHS